MKKMIFFPPVIAHRGASAYAPENTMVAFTKAIQLGSKWIECDVQLTRLNEVVVCHDDTLNRTTNSHGLLKNCSYAYLQSLDAGKWFHPIFSMERIPSLQQTLVYLADKGISLNIELKPEPGREADLVEAVLSITKNIPYQAIQLLYSSFCLKTLQYLQSRDSNAPIGFLMHELIPNWQTVANQLNVSSINLNKDILTPELAREVKGMHKALTCYTVNDSATASELYALGVDAVFTDKPDIILSTQI